MLRAPVIRVGAMGQNHARVYSELDEVQLVGVVDYNAETGNGVASRYGTRAYTTFAQMLDAGQIDLRHLRTRMAQPILIDGRHLFAAEQARVAGWVYRAVGVGCNGSQKGHDNSCSLWSQQAAVSNPEV